APACAGRRIGWQGQRNEACPARDEPALPPLAAVARAPEHHFVTSFWFGSTRSDDDRPIPAILWRQRERDHFGPVERLTQHPPRLAAVVRGEQAPAGEGCQDGRRRVVAGRSSCHGPAGGGRI